MVIIIVEFKDFLSCIKYSLLWMVSDALNELYSINFPHLLENALFLALDIECLIRLQQHKDRLQYALNQLVILEFKASHKDVDYLANVIIVLYKEGVTCALVCATCNSIRQTPQRFFHQVDIVRFG